jgi:hypothetical protein
MFLSRFFAYYRTYSKHRFRIIFGHWIRTRIKVSWSPGGWQIPIALMSSRIRIRIEVMSIKVDGWLGKLVARLLATAATLWVRIQTSLKKYKMGDIRKGVTNSL